jgi:hypothetical protein
MFSKFKCHMFYFLYLFVTCLLTFPRVLGEKCIATSVKIYKGERAPGRPRRRWENNIKMSLFRSRIWTRLICPRNQWPILANRVINLQVSFL